jgi:hypothetical protein
MKKWLKQLMQLRRLNQDFDTRKWDLYSTVYIPVDVFCDDCRLVRNALENRRYKRIRQCRQRERTLVYLSVIIRLK